MAPAFPACGVSWNLLAGIGRIESMHANGGATDAPARRCGPSTGPRWTARCPATRSSCRAGSSGRVVYARAMGPMQFLPGTWSRYASDGDGDGKADPQNVLRRGAGRRTLSVQRRPEPARPVAGDDRDPAVQQLDAVRPERARLGGGLRDRRGPGRPAADHRADSADRADAHLDNPEGLGPGLPITALGLPPTTRCARSAGQPRAAPTSPASCSGRCQGPPPESAMPGVTQPGPAQSLPPGMEPPRAELRGVLPRRQPARRGAATAATRGAAARHRSRRPPGRPSSHRRPARTGRTRAAGRGRLRRRHRHPRRPDSRRTGPRPVRPPDRRPRLCRCSAHAAPPTLGGDVRTSQ